MGMKYAVASKRCRNHFVSENYKTLQSFKLRCLQNISLVQLYNFARHYWFVGNVPGNHCVQAFSALPSHFYDVSRVTKFSSQQCSFRSREHIKIRWSQVRRVRGMLQRCHIVFSYEILDQNQPVCWSIVMKENQSVCLHFSGSCLLTASSRRQMISMYISVFTFLPSGMNPYWTVHYKLYQRISGTFWSC
jgi:hypothetical protein